MAAKFLWKRVLPSLKNGRSGSNLNTVWDVARCQINGRISEALSLLRSSSWSEDVMELIESWDDSIVYSYLQRVATTYSSIAVEKLSKELVLSTEETLECSFLL